jgi:hypothetical protein
MSREETFTIEVLNPEDTSENETTAHIIGTTTGPTKHPPDPMYGNKHLKEASRGINNSKTVNSLIATFTKASHKDETHNGLLVFDWAYRCVIGDGKAIPWTYFANEPNLVRTLTDRYIYALRDHGYICEGTWPEIRKAKKRE